MTTQLCPRCGELLEADDIRPKVKVNGELLYGNASGVWIPGLGYVRDEALPRYVIERGWRIERLVDESITMREFRL